MTQFKMLVKKTGACLVAAALVGGLFAGGLSTAWAEDENTATALTGNRYKDGWQVDYTIPADAGSTVTLDGRAVMDMLVARGYDYNDMWPGTWTGGWFTLRNNSPYYYKVTDVSFGLDHSQKQEDSIFLRDLDYNAYAIGHYFHGDERPDVIRNRETGAVGFDGYEIPGSMAVLRSSNKAIASYYGLSDSYSLNLDQVLNIDKELAAKGMTYADLLLQYYRSADRFSPLMTGVSSFSQLPLYCLTDNLCGPNYELWLEADPTGLNRWQIGDIRLEARFYIPREGSNLRYPSYVTVYDTYDADNNPHYFYADKNEFGEDAQDVEIDVNSPYFDYIAPKGFRTDNNFFDSRKVGTIPADADNWFTDNGEYFAIETDPDVIKMAYDTFYSDMLAFTMDRTRYPLANGRQEVTTVIGSDELFYSTYTEGAEGMHYRDFLEMNGTAAESIDNSIGQWMLSPKGAEDGNDYLSTYPNLRLSGQNTPNNYCGTEFMRGLTFTATLERVQAGYSIEYYQDSLDADHLLATDRGFMADVNEQVSFPQDALDKYLPSKGGYTGALQGESSLIVSLDPEQNVFRVLYTHAPYGVFYDANGGVGTRLDPNSPYFADDAVTVLDEGAIVRDGWSFTGWNTAPDGSGDAYSPADTFTMPQNDVTLYAQWEEDEEIPDGDLPLVGPGDNDPEVEAPEEEIPDQEVPLTGGSGSGLLAVVCAAVGAAMAAVVCGKKKASSR